MFENINKSKLTFDEYVKLKTESVTKSYTERFKWVNRILYGFSWFGNGVSVFLAFFFIQSLFLSSFLAVSDSILISLGIVTFLSMFELLKRYVFGMFSFTFIKNRFSLFKSNMIGFLIGVFILISGSFYFSLNGAQEFVDNRQVFTEETKVDLSNQVDSINRFYQMEYIGPLLDEIRILTDQNTQYADQASETRFITRYTGLIDDNNKKIESNRLRLDAYEQRRDNKIKELREDSQTRLSNILSTTRSNILIFILISTMIEFIIMLGVYYSKLYKNKKVEEYESTIISTPEFKTWYKFNDLLNMIYSKVTDIGEPIPSTNALFELSELTGQRIDKTTMDKFIKTLYYLNIVQLRGNRRHLNLSKEDGLNTLKNYFEIK